MQSKITEPYIPPFSWNKNPISHMVSGEQQADQTKEWHFFTAWRRGAKRHTIQRTVQQNV
jgi:hypothetical protein